MIDCLTTPQHKNKSAIGCQTNGIQCKFSQRQSNYLYKMLHLKTFSWVLHQQLSLEGSTMLSFTLQFTLNAMENKLPYILNMILYDSMILVKKRMWFYYIIVLANNIIFIKYRTRQIKATETNNICVCTFDLSRPIFKKQ